MNGFLITRNELDLGRGTALLVSGAVMVLLTYVLPAVAPIAIFGYGLYRLFKRQVREALISMALGVVLYFLMGLLEWLLWLCGAGMVGLGLFFLIRGFRASADIDNRSEF